MNRILVVCALALVVAACGGGGGSSTASAPDAVADTGPVTGVATPTSVSVVTATQ